MAERAFWETVTRLLKGVIERESDDAHKRLLKSVKKAIDDYVVADR